MNNSKFIPALRFHWLTGAYNAVVGQFMPERRFKNALISRAQLTGHEDILDFGVGTATLSLMLKKVLPSLNITGIDIDEKMLNIAKSKTIGSNLHLLLYDGDKLPFGDENFDRVVSSLVIHHLTDTQRLAAFREMLRVLRPGGSLVVADWGQPASVVQRFLFYLIQWLDGFETTTANVKGIVPEMATTAGFNNVLIHERFQTVFGTLEIYTGEKNPTKARDRI